MSRDDIRRPKKARRDLASSDDTGKPLGEFCLRPVIMVKMIVTEQVKYDSLFLNECKKGTVVLVPSESYYFLNSNSDRIDRYLSILVIWR